MTLLQQIEQRYRHMYVERMKKFKATGWENRTIDDVEHLGIDDMKLIALIQVIEERLETHNDDHQRADYNEMMKGF